MMQLPPHLRKRGAVSESASSAGNASESSCHSDDAAAEAAAVQVYGIYDEDEGPSVSCSGSGDDAAEATASERE
jgi:hypothetical protein